MRNMKKRVLGALLLVGSIAAFAQVAQGVIYQFTGGDATSNGLVIANINGNSTLYGDVTEYIEDGVRMRVEGGVISVGNYYPGGGNAVIHGHWSQMNKVIFERVNGEAFDLNYYKLTSNPLPNQGGAGGNGVVSIVASQDGVTESFRATLPAEPWGDEFGGDQSVTEVYLGPEFKGVKAVWFESDTPEFKCFGMDTFYIDEAPPPPSTPGAIVVGSGTLEEAAGAQGSAPAPAVPVPSLTFFGLLFMGILLGYLGIRQLIA